MKFALPAAIALTLATTAGAAQARMAMQPSEPTFYATPMNSGAPENLPGETIIPGMSLAMHTVNMVTQPILQPILAPGGAAPGAEAPMAQPMMHHHRHMMMHHRHMMMHHRHMMMHHKMMMKKSM